jgi:alcohol dehydrogenase (NADP+)
MRVAISILPLAVLATAQAQYADQQPLDDFPTREGGAPKPLSLDIPLLGFGTWNLKENCSQAVSFAIQQGYRHIDCAAAYGNEKEVGQGIAEGLAITGLKREDLWITSKLWNDQ